MIRRRYPIALGVLGVALAVLAWWTASEWARVVTESSVFVFDGSEPEDQETRFLLLQQFGSTLVALMPWAVLGACVASIAALTLLALRARDQAGSASAATASRDASAASSRS